MRDGTVIELGKHRLRFIETPHVHHWDSMMVFEETTRSLFPADLFIQPGEQPPVVTEDLGRPCARSTARPASSAATARSCRRWTASSGWSRAWVHPMHGGSIPGASLARYIHALRTLPFAYEGKVFGRMLPT